MKHLLLIFFLGLTTFTFGQKTIERKAVDLRFDHEHLELGEVKRGEKRTFQYAFTNVGTDDITIDIVSGCDCTTLEWTKGAIKPGERGVIDVIFDSTEKEASETVDVDVYLVNIDPKWDAGYLFVLDYTFELVQ